MKQLYATRAELRARCKGGVYTIGLRELYTPNLARNQDDWWKLGRRPPGGTASNIGLGPKFESGYPGGSVFRTEADARRWLQQHGFSDRYDVYLLDNVDWYRDTEPTDQGYNNLLPDARILPLPKALHRRKHVDVWSVSIEWVDGDTMVHSTWTYDDVTGSLRHVSGDGYLPTEVQEEIAQRPNDGTLVAEDHRFIWHGRHMVGRREDNEYWRSEDLDDVESFTVMLEGWEVSTRTLHQGIYKLKPDGEWVHVSGAQYIEFEAMNLSRAAELIFMGYPSGVVVVGGRSRLEFFRRKVNWKYRG